VWISALLALFRFSTIQKALSSTVYRYCLLFLSSFYFWFFNIWIYSVVMTRSMTGKNAYTPSNLRWPIRVIHAQNVKSPHNIMKHANKWAIHATISRFTPQFHDSRHNSTIHATISRFTPQFHDSHHKEADSHHKETADRSRSQYWLN
jgi:hypothetical protein